MVEKKINRPVTIQDFLDFIKENKISPDALFIINGISVTGIRSEIGRANKEDYFGHKIFSKTTKGKETGIFFLKWDEFSDGEVDDGFEF